MLGIESGTAAGLRRCSWSWSTPTTCRLVETTLRRALREPRAVQLHASACASATLPEERLFECYGEVFTDPDGRPARVLGTAHDITETRRAQDELAYLADHDALTGLANRRSFTARLDGLLGCAAAAARCCWSTSTTSRTSTTCAGTPSATR